MRSRVPLLAMYEHTHTHRERERERVCSDAFVVMCTTQKEADSLDTQRVDGGADRARACPAYHWESGHHMWRIETGNTRVYHRSMIVWFDDGERDGIGEELLNRTASDWKRMYVCVCMRQGWHGWEWNDHVEDHSTTVCIENPYDACECRSGWSLNRLNRVLWIWFANCTTVQCMNALECSEFVIRHVRVDGT